MSPLLCLLAALLLGAPPGPGRYTGEVPGGRIDLVLFEDGRAIFGGAALRWTTQGEALVLKAPGGRAINLTMRHGDGGAVLDGSDFGPIRLMPLPASTPARPAAPVRPLDWVGAWRHDAPGGALILRLRGDGRYAMEQPTTGGVAIPPATGQWHAVDGRLVLTPDGGAPLSYVVRRDAADLVIGGGDLPAEVRFAADQPR